MKKIKDISEALNLFQDAAIKHAEATEQGDYKIANKNYDTIAKTIEFLKQHNAICSLLEYLNHNSIGVKIWAATYLLPTNEKEATQVLEQIIREKGIQSFDAKMVLSEWGKGNLN